MENQGEQIQERVTGKLGTEWANDKNVRDVQPLTSQETIKHLSLAIALVISLANLGILASTTTPSDTSLITRTLDTSNVQRADRSTGASLQHLDANGCDLRRPLLSPMRKLYCMAAGSD